MQTLSFSRLRYQLISKGKTLIFRETACEPSVAQKRMSVGDVVVLRVSNARRSFQFGG